MTIHTPTYPGGVLTLTAAKSYSGPSIRIMCDGGFVIPRPFTRPEPEPDPPAVVDDSPAALIARLTAGDAGENS